jgi:hypothetical protein
MATPLTELIKLRIWEKRELQVSEKKYFIFATHKVMTSQQARNWEGSFCLYPPYFFSAANITFKVN